MTTGLSTRIAFILVYLGAGGWAFAANISMTKTRDLQFTKATQGDSAGTESASSGNSNSAKYTVTGDAGKAYKVTLPTSVSMAGAGTSIVANTFTKSSDNSWTLNGSGQDTVYIGATRAAIPGGQTPGSYTVNFQPIAVYTTGGKSSKPSTAAAIDILATITVTKVSDLAFGEAATGAVALTINPASDSGRAQYTVTGTASTAYTITLPDSATMITGAGATADTQIAVSSFTSSPASPDTLPGGGSRTLYVGATRAAIRDTQTTGSYTTSFQITVTYQ